MNRRDFLLTGTSGLAAMSVPANLKAAGLHQLGGAERFRIGQTTVTALSDGYVDLINSDSLMGIGEEGYQDSIALAGRGAGSLQSDINAYLVDDGQRKVLIDAGGSSSFIGTLGGTPDALRSAGYHPDEVTHILMSHLHPDHVSGVLNDDGTAIYPNAEMVIHAQEFDFWVTSDAHLRMTHMTPFFEIAQNVAKAYDGRIRLYSGTDVGIQGISAERMFGHTPGHVGFVIESANEHVLVTSDIVLHSVIQLMHPDVSVAFDLDAEAANAVRRRILERVASSRERVVGMHFPFPGLGRIERSGSGYRWVAEERHFF